MTTQVQNILRSFDLLPEADKHEFTSKIIQRSLELDAPALSDEQFVSLAEEIFQGLDESEADDA